jgi:hypothetical protein
VLQPHNQQIKVMRVPKGGLSGQVYSITSDIQYGAPMYFKYLLFKGLKFKCFLLLQCIAILFQSNLNWATRIQEQCIAFFQK